MPVFESTLDVNSEEFAQNRAEMLALVDRLRSGRRVRVVIWTQGMFDETVFGVLESAKMISEAAACDNGHRYPTDVGFKFCPKCGHEIIYK